MSKAIQQQKYYKILVVGDACLDVYFFGTCDRLSPEAPVPVFKRKRIKNMQGMCLNVASNLRVFGHDVRVDRNDEKIKKIRIVDEKTGHHLLRVDEEPEIKNIDVRRYTKKTLAGYDAIVISDYDKGYITQGDILDILEPAKFREIPVFVDSKKKDLRNFDGCIIKINEDEKSKLTNLPKNCELLVTLGSKGCLWNDKIYPSEKVDVHDVTGAGDVFLASFVHMYLSTSGNIPESIKFANKCASISVSHFGTCVIDLKEIS